jgi:SPP1 family predicted phage head-tail adaptor
MGLTAKFTELITIQKWYPSGSTDGNPDGIWKDLKTMYVSILNQNGSTGFNAPGNLYTDTIQFYSRFILLDGTKGYRIKYRDQLYSILNYTVTQRNKDIILSCKATF